MQLGAHEYDVVPKYSKVMLVFRVPVHLKADCTIVVCTIDG